MNKPQTKQTINIFLSGGMTNLSEEEATEWRQDIIDYFSLTNVYIKCFDPTKNFSTNQSFEDFSKELEFMYNKIALTHDLHLLSNSDVVICNLNSPNSIGTAQELFYAYEHNIPIIILCPEETIPHMWYQIESQLIVTYTPDNFMETVDSVASVIYSMFF